jgi:hypothetical protein
VVDKKEELYQCIEDQQTEEASKKQEGSDIA